MKITDRNATRQGDLSYRKKTVMGVAKGALAEILNNQIEMYKHPYVAVLREYTSNARDSNRAVGSDAPVVVELPTPLSPSLAIRDQGLGLDEDEMDLFGQFGESSKQSNNDDIGGFGLGSKSGLAIAPRFTVSSVKNGIRNVAIIHRDKHGAPTMGFISDPVEVSDPNGVSVIIPTTETEKLKKAIKRGLFLGWEPGSIRVDGYDGKLVSVHDNPDFTYFEGMGWFYIGDVSKRPYSTSVYEGLALIAGVGFPLDWSQINPDLPDTLRGGLLENFILDIPNGSVKMLRSREGLIYDKNTTKVVRDILDKIVYFGSTRFQEDIDKAENFREAYKIYLRALDNGYKSRKFVYEGRVLTESLKILENWAFVTTPTGYNTTHWDHSEYPGAPISLHTNRLGHASWHTYTQKVMRDQLDYTSTRHSSDPRNLIKIKRSVLVYSATPQPRKGTWGNVTEMATANTFFDALVRSHDLKRSEIGVYYTSYPLEQLNPWWVSLFTQTLTPDQYRSINAEERKAKAADLRQKATTNDAGVPTTPVESNKRAKASAGNVKRLTQLPGNDMWPREESVPVENLEKTSMHVILDPSKFEDIDLRRTLTTKVGRSENKSTYNAVLMLQRRYGFSIIVYNKTDKVPANVPNVTTLEDIAKKAWDESCTKVSDEEIKIVNEAAGWTYSISEFVLSKHFNTIKSKTTRNWMKKISDESSSAEIKNRLEEESSLQSRIKNSGLISTDAKAVKYEKYSKYFEQTEMFSRYPLSFALVRISNPSVEDVRKDLAEYINLKDSEALTQG